MTASPEFFDEVDRQLDDAARLRAVQLVLATDLPPEVEQVTHDLADEVGVPYAAVTVLDARDQHVVAATAGPSSCARESSHCQYVVGTGSVLAINNTEASSLWRRLRRNLVGGMPLQAYLGVPLLVGRPGAQEVIGAVCVVDVEPRVWTAPDHLAVTVAARKVARLLDR